MRKIFLLPLILIMLTQNFIFNAGEAVTDEPLKRMSETAWWASDILTAEGRGLIQNNDIMLAKRAAMLDGYRNLAKAAGNVKVTAKDTLSEEKIAAVINGAEVTFETYDENGNCTVVLSVPIYGLKNSIAQAAFEPVDKKNFPAPTGNVIAKGNYTGLIIDCGDMELNPVLSPVIVDAQNQSIYSRNNLDYDKVIAQGMIGYADKNSFDFRKEDLVIPTSSNFLLAKADKNRAGTNPLVIKAESLGEDNSCPVISAEDANKILAENLATHFLDEGAVVFTSNRIRGMRL